MSTPVKREDWEKPGVCCLSQGRAGNATVYRLETPDGVVVIKDFRPCPWWIRWTWGRWMVAHEYRLMKCLEGVEGVPQKLFLVDKYAFGMEFLKGITVSEYNHRFREKMCGRIPEVFLKEEIPLSFYRDLERLVCKMHRRKVTHLDARNAKNVLILPGWKPALIDFQSGVYIQKWFPRWVKKILQLADLSSVYKHYYCNCVRNGEIVEGKGAFPASRARLFVSHIKLRKLWVLEGYKFISHRKTKDYERVLLSRYDDKANGRA